jgi:hypothetical protein
MEQEIDKSKSRRITSRRISKFKRKFGDVDRNMSDVLRKPTLTHRDKDVLLSVYYHRCLTTRQIAEMHYKYNYKGTENSQAELIARRRLRSMFDNQLIDRFFVDVGNEGSSQGHIVLDQLGAKVVAGLLNLDVSELSWRYEMNETRLPYLEHMVDTNNFYIWLLREARKLGHEVAGFRTENHCRHEFTFWGKKMVCNPDAYGQYWFKDKDKDSEEGMHFFLEWDNGTMSPAVFQKKHQRYTAYYASNEYAPIYREFPLILTVAPTKDRALALRNTIYGIDNTDLQWLFASRDEIELNPLGKVWYNKNNKPVALM